VSRGGTSTPGGGKKLPYYKPREKGVVSRPPLATPKIRRERGKGGEERVAELSVPCSLRERGGLGSGKGRKETGFWPLALKERTRAAHLAKNLYSKRGEGKGKGVVSMLAQTREKKKGLS